MTYVRNVFGHFQRSYSIYSRMAVYCMGTVLFLSMPRVCEECVCVCPERGRLAKSRDQFRNVDEG